MSNTRAVIVEQSDLGHVHDQPRVLVCGYQRFCDRENRRVSNRNHGHIDVDACRCEITAQ